MHVGPVPAGSEVCHNCGHRPCVNPAHLRADTHQANMADCLVHGTHTRGARNGRARLTVGQVAYVRAAVAAGCQQNLLASELGVSPQTVNHIVRGRTWAADEIALVAD
jgi:DNA-binding XRE family transcriptional regulator